MELGWMIAMTICPLVRSTILIHSLSSWTGEALCSCVVTLTTVFSDESGVQLTGDTGLGAKRFRHEDVLFQPKNHELPDGDIITVGSSLI